jgi:hypothetical protein
VYIQDFDYADRSREMGRKEAPYGMRSVLKPLEVHHTVETGVGSAAALVSMRVEFLLGEDVAAVLLTKGQKSVRWV